MLFAVREPFKNVLLLLADHVIFPVFIFPAPYILVTVIQSTTKAIAKLPAAPVTSAAIRVKRKSDCFIVDTPLLFMRF